MHCSPGCWKVILESWDTRWPTWIRFQRWVGSYGDRGSGRGTRAHQSEYDGECCTTHERREGNIIIMRYQEPRERVKVKVES